MHVVFLIFPCIKQTVCKVFKIFQCGKYLVAYVLKRKFNRNFASTNPDNESFCTVVLASQVVMIQSLQPKGLEFESTCVLFLPLFDSFNFIYYRCTTTFEE